MSFRTLISALDGLNKNDIVIAQDISSSGQKVFLRRKLKELIEIYDTLASKHWYECLLERRPSRIFLDVESSSMVVHIQDIVERLRQAIQLKYNITPEIKVLDSCSDQKQSWHVLCTNIYLKNVYHVGAFVRRFVLSMQDSPNCASIDTAVYTKNRMFRVNQSSKYGSLRILKHEDPWWTLLVQTENVPYVECLEIDQSIPVSTSAHPEHLFEFVNGAWSKRKSNRRVSANASPSSCPCLTPILDWLDTNISAKTCRHNTSFTEEGHYRVSTRSKICQIAHRTHRGNNIWFDVDVNRQIVYQKCYDEECRHKSAVVDVPVQLWSRWNTTWSQLIHAPINKKTLYNMSN